MSYLEDQRKKAQKSKEVKAVTAVVKPIVQPIQSTAAAAGGGLSQAAKDAQAAVAAQTKAAAAAVKAKADAAAKALATQQAAVANAGGAFSKTATDAWKAAGGQLDPTGSRPILSSAADIAKWGSIQGGGKDPNAALKGLFGDSLPTASLPTGANFSALAKNSGFGGSMPGGTIGDLTKGIDKSVLNPLNVFMPGVGPLATVAKNAGGEIGGAVGGPVGDFISNITGKPNSFINKSNGDGTDKKVNGTGASDFINANMPTYNTPLNEDGTLKSAFSVSPQAATHAHQLGMPATATAGTYDPKLLDTKALGVDTRALDALRTKGLTVGDTPWAAMQKQQNALNETSAKDAAGAQALTARDSALSSLAMRGGIGGGAAERLGTAASRDMNAARQAATRTRYGADLSTGIADESQKNTLLTNVAGQDLSNAQFGAGLAQFNAGASNDASKFNIGTGLDAQKFNIGAQLDTGKFNENAQQNADQFNSNQAYDATKTNAGNALAGRQGENAFNLGKFQTQIAGFGSDRTANAIANAGKK